MSRDGAGALAVLLATTAYAVLRYNVFSRVAWIHLPLYVLNKSVAWSSILLLAMAAWRGATRHDARWTEAPWFAVGSALALFHVLMSLALLGPGNYPALYSAGRFTLAGEITLLGGALGALAITGASRWTALAFLLPTSLGIHTTAIGLRNWVHPAEWPGHMVPISLWSALTALAMVVAAVAAGGQLDRRR